MLQADKKSAENLLKGFTNKPLLKEDKSAFQDSINDMVNFANTRLKGVNLTGFFADISKGLTDPTISAQKLFDTIEEMQDNLAALASISNRVSLPYLKEDQISDVIKKAKAYKEAVDEYNKINKSLDKYSDKYSLKAEDIKEIGEDRAETQRRGKYGKKYHEKLASDLGISESDYSSASKENKELMQEYARTSGLLDQMIAKRKKYGEVNNISDADAYVKQSREIFDVYKRLEALQGRVVSAFGLKGNNEALLLPTNILSQIQEDQERSLEEYRKFALENYAKNVNETNQELEKSITKSAAKQAANASKATEAAVERSEKNIKKASELKGTPQKRLRSNTGGEAGGGSGEGAGAGGVTGEMGAAADSARDLGEAGKAAGASVSEGINEASDAVQELNTKIAEAESRLQELQSGTKTKTLSKDDFKKQIQSAIDYTEKLMDEGADEKKIAKAQQYALDLYGTAMEFEKMPKLGDSYEEAIGNYGDWNQDYEYKTLSKIVDEDAIQSQIEAIRKLKEEKETLVNESKSAKVNAGGDTSAKTEEEIKGVSSALESIPTSKDISININGEQALQDIAGVKDQLESLPETKNISIQVDAPDKKNLELLRETEDTSVKVDVPDTKSLDLLSKIQELDKLYKDSGETELGVAFNEKTGYASSFARGTGSRSVKTNGIVAEANGRATSILHTHPGVSVPAFSVGDIAPFFDDYFQRNIQKQFVKAGNKIASLDVGKLIGAGVTQGDFISQLNSSLHKATLDFKKQNFQSFALENLIPENYEEVLRKKISDAFSSGSFGSSEEIGSLVDDLMKQITSNIKQRLADKEVFDTGIVNDELENAITETIKSKLKSANYSAVDNLSQTVQEAVDEIITQKVPKVGLENEQLIRQRAMSMAIGSFGLNPQDFYNVMDEGNWLKSIYPNAEVDLDTSEAEEKLDDLTKERKVEVKVETEESPGSDSGSRVDDLEKEVSAASAAADANRELEQARQEADKSVESQREKTTAELYSEDKSMLGKKAGNIEQLREQYQLLKLINQSIEQWDTTNNGGVFAPMKGSREELQKYKDEILELNPQLKAVADRTDSIRPTKFRQMFDSSFPSFDRLEESYDRIFALQRRMQDAGPNVSDSNKTRWEADLQREKEAFLEMYDAYNKMSNGAMDTDIPGRKNIQDMREYYTALRAEMKAVNEEAERSRVESPDSSLDDQSKQAEEAAEAARKRAEFMEKANQAYQETFADTTPADTTGDIDKMSESLAEAYESTQKLTDARRELNDVSETGDSAGDAQKAADAARERAEFMEKAAKAYKDQFADTHPSTDPSSIQAAAQAIMEEGEAAEKAAKSKEDFTAANEKAALSGKETASSMKEAAGGIADEGGAAEKAAKSKEDFTKANKKAADSGKDAKQSSIYDYDKKAKHGEEIEAAAQARARKAEEDGMTTSIQRMYDSHHNLVQAIVTAQERMKDDEGRITAVKSTMTNLQYKKNGSEEFLYASDKETSDFARGSKEYARYINDAVKNYEKLSLKQLKQPDLFTASDAESLKEAEVIINEINEKKQKGIQLTKEELDAQKQYVAATETIEANRRKLQQTKLEDDTEKLKLEQQKNAQAAKDAAAATAKADAESAANAVREQKSAVDELISSYEKLADVESKRNKDEFDLQKEADLKARQDQLIKQIDWGTVSTADMGRLRQAESNYQMKITRSSASKDLSDLISQYKEAAKTYADLKSKDVRGLLPDGSNALSESKNNLLAIMDKLKEKQAELNALKEKGAAISEKDEKALNEAMKITTKNIDENINASRQDDAVKSLRSLITSMEKQSSWRVGGWTEEIENAKASLKELVNFDFSGENSAKEFESRYTAAVAEIKRLMKDTEFLPVKDTWASNMTSNIEKWANTNKMAGKAYADQLDEIKAKIKEVNSAAEASEVENMFNDLQSTAAQDGLLGKSLGDRFADQFKNTMTSLSTYYLGFQDFVRYGREAISMVTELDTQLTEMRKVSSESLQTLQDYQLESFDIADRVGTTAAQIQSSTADWMRLGEDLSEAKQSAEASTLLLNVSEFQSIDEATEALTAMSQAYQDLEKIEIIDKLNNIGRGCLIIRRRIRLQHNYNY